MLKLDDNPPVTHPERPLAEIAGRWFVGHTKARFEKAFAWDLLRADVAYFLPMVEKVSFSGGRKRRGMMPLFAGYVFFAGDDETRLTAMKTNRFCQVIPAPDQAGLLLELSSLQKALESKAMLDPYPYAAVGRRCRITAGPFEGVEGIVVQRPGICKLVLQVSMLGQGAAMEIDAAVVESIE